MKKFLVVLGLCPLFFISAVLADERILSFHSDILIQQDGWIDVTETIRVQAEGQRIQRGIYRDFPTEYQDKLGNRYQVEFRPIAVLRNNEPEAFHSQPLRNGVRTYFGSATSYIPQGEHIYTFRYRANRMLGFFAEHDELYWNVTGFDWIFPIDQATANVTLSFNPTGGLSYEAYTGPFGASQRNYTASAELSNRVDFEATTPLSSNNGMTIVVGWPKGYVRQPTSAQRFGWFLKDNINVMVSLAGLLLLLAYCLPVWFWFGKDPEEGVIVTRYHPPELYSPASLRYIQQMYYDDKVMTAAVINLAVKGYLRINVEDEADQGLLSGLQGAKHSLSKLNPDGQLADLAAGEKELLSALFADANTVQLDKKNHALLGVARRMHRVSLKRDYSRRYFRTNVAWSIPAFLIIMITFVAASAVSNGSATLGVIVVVAMSIATISFITMMRKPTLRGRALLDEMLGFKDYLEVAEKDDLNHRNPPRKTPQLFEKYLPYALALDVDQEWAEQFSEVFGSIGETGKKGFEPSWYAGRWSSNDFATTTHQLSNSISRSISSSVRAPGSSSGSSGGGSSGGGGGGGGGGGW